MEGGDRPAVVGQVELGGEQALEPDLFLTVVDELCAAGDHVTRGIDIVVQLEEHPVLLEGQAQVLDPAVLAVGAGQGVECGLAFCDLTAAVQKVGRTRPVGADKLDEGLADVAVTLARAFQTDILERGGVVLLGIDDDVAGLELALLAQREQLVKRFSVDLRAGVQMLGLYRRFYRNDVGGVVGLQGEG